LEALTTVAGLRWALEGNASAVALTFDDGPDPVYTPAILDELGRLGVVATFFVVGHRAQAHPAIVRRMIGEGHAVGSHSFSHPDPWTVPMRRLIDEYRQGRAQVEWAAERPTPLFRPPKGSVTLVGAAAMLVAKVQPRLWTIDSGDWVPGVTSEEIVGAVAEIGSRDVVLLHDAIEGPLAPSALDRSATCAALAAIVALGRERVLDFATLS
jgi:peptidoglycan/xylan/chitin deacetylase (PgdA/CDA1 family)